ncbi:MAG: HEPN domain-containing protein [Endomicrobia bacterium]|nr:HEPN domain-containing protein [Endomicrobiia bacterium]MDW8055685.1 HEPN domain-containing protein [Elusimicrobiota bacterium]
MEKIDFLKQRAKEFWDEANRLFNEGKYNLAAFSLEQAVQLYIKYLIAKKVGEWPKIHYLPDLFKKLAEIEEDKEFYEFYENNEIFFDDLSDAYFTSRYLPKEFNRSLVSALLENCKKFFKFIEEKLNERFDVNQ